MQLMITDLVSILGFIQPAEESPISLVQNIDRDSNHHNASGLLYFDIAISGASVAIGNDSPNTCNHNSCGITVRGMFSLLSPSGSLLLTTRRKRISGQD